MIDRLHGKKIAILGYWLEGQSTFSFLREKGIDASMITILDKNAALEMPDGVHHCLGEDYLSVESTFDYIFTAPGITATKRRGTRVAQNHQHEQFWSQSQLFFKLYQGTVIGVTWSKGKSSTATFIAKMLARTGQHVALAGNVWIPALDVLRMPSQPQIVVYELSSYMLESLHEFQLNIGILTSLHEAHIGAHGGAENYVAAKMKLVKNSKHVLISSQVLTSELLWENSATVIKTLHNRGTLQFFGADGAYKYANNTFFKHDEPITTDDHFQPLGVHMRHNMCAALGVADMLDVSPKHFIDELMYFEGLEHRIEYIWTYRGINRYNDSFATIVEAVVMAIQTLADDLDTIFVGGEDTGADIIPLVEAIQGSHIRNIVFFPDVGSRIAEHFSGSKRQCFSTDSMHEAVQRAARVTEPGRAALLSCGFPSFTMFTNYVERGLAFKNEVTMLEETREET